MSFYRLLLAPVTFLSLTAADPGINLHLIREGELESLSWSAVPGATRYAIFAFPAGAAAPVWVWTGTGTKVAVGDPLDPDLAAVIRLARARQPHPRLVPASGLEYVALAFDAHGDLVKTRPRSRL